MNIQHTKVVMYIFCMGLCACAANANAENLPDLDCLLEPNMTVELSSPVPGVIDSIMVDRSDAVSKDQVLASLMADVEQEKYNMALAKAHYQGDLESSKVNLKLSEKESRRATELYRERAIALNEKEQAIAKLELARFELDKAMHDNEVFELELNEARANLELRQIRSPIDGVVVDRYMMPGEFVDNKPVLKVAQLNPLRVEVISQVANFGKIKPGMHAYVIPEFGEYDKLVAEVAVVDKVIDAASGTFGVRLMLDNEGYRVPGGLKCRLHFMDEQEEAAYQQALVVEAVLAESSEIAEATDAAQESSADTIEVASTDHPSQCYTLGPLMKRDSFEILQAGLNKKLVLSNTREQQHDVNTYLVSTAELETMDQALALEVKFKAAGIRDIAIMHQGKQLHISLGLYSNKRSAKRRHAELEKLGFSVEMSSRRSEKTRYWYDLELDAASDATALGSKIAELARDFKIPGAGKISFTQCADSVARQHASSGNASKL